MILLSIYVDEQGEHQEGGNIIVNFDQIQTIEFNQRDRTLNFGLAGNPYLCKLYLSQEATEHMVMAKFWLSMQSAFEGRLNTVAAVKVTLDLRGV